MGFIMAVTGESGSGKTELMCALIAELSGRGWKVGAIKHSHHEAVNLDSPGKDTDRMHRSGAYSVAIASRRMVTAYRDTEHEWGPEEVVERFFPDAEVVLVEGYNLVELPRVGLVKKSLDELPATKGLFALVAGDEVEIDSRLPRFTPGQVREIADFIEKRLGARNRQSAKSIKPASP